MADRYPRHLDTHPCRIHLRHNPPFPWDQAEALDEGVHTVIASKEARNHAKNRGSMEFPGWYCRMGFPCSCGNQPGEMVLKWY